jgi:protein-L-isoaspartate(D-aspartate) O-methyltransferase
MEGVTPDSFEAARERMVRAQLLSRGVLDPRVIGAMSTVPREAFVPPHLQEDAYADAPLSIGEGQTISQPYVVAAMLAALELRGDEKVLEVGAGSGYAAAVLGRCVREVWALERIPSLAASARARMERVGYRNVHVLHGDGTRGLPEQAPFDAILVSAGGPRIPPALLEQLAPGGRLLMPVGPVEHARDEQRLVRVERDAEGLHETRLEPVRFVPLIAG